MSKHGGSSLSTLKIVGLPVAGARRHGTRGRTGRVAMEKDNAWGVSPRNTWALGGRSADRKELHRQKQTQTNYSDLVMGGGHSKITL
jgi:hypothetical protein